MKKTRRHVSKNTRIQVDYLLILASTVTSWVSISAFASLVCVLVGITSSAVGMKIGWMTVRTKKKHDKIVLLWKSK